VNLGPGLEPSTTEIGCQLGNASCCVSCCMCVADLNDASLKYRQPMLTWRQKWRRLVAESRTIFTAFRVCLRRRRNFRLKTPNSLERYLAAGKF